jgi:hypothetical protein
MKEGLWTTVFMMVVLVPFFIFVANGWPGAMDDCLSDNKAQKPSITENTCYCETFEIKDVKNGAPGVRQPFNTWSNLYVLISGPFLAFVVWSQRRKREDSRIPTDDRNRFRRRDLYPIFYVQVVIFLGLGSMWFHASIVSWGGIFDQMSMYALIDFILFYTLVRLFNKDLWFYIGYPVAFVLYFVLALLHASSVVVILITLIIYGILELIILIGKPDVRGGTYSWDSWYEFLNPYNWAEIWVYWKYWIIGILSFVVAIILRGKSDTGGPLCINCSSAFQYHGLWHILCGITAVMIYYHWKEAKR